MVDGCHCLSGQRAMSTGLGSSINAGGYQFEQKLSKTHIYKFQFSVLKKNLDVGTAIKPSTPHILQNLQKYLHTALTHTIFRTVATLMSEQIG